MCSDIFLIIENLFISAPHFTKIAQSCLMYMPYYREKNGERKSKGAGRRNKAIMWSKILKYTNIYLFIR